MKMTCEKSKLNKVSMTQLLGLIEAVIDVGRK